MPYDLAKQLKDAGFVSKADFKEYARMYCPHPNKGIESIGHIPNCPEAIYFPHLEELIEACGGNFESLHFRKRFEQPWTVFGFVYCVSGSTPAEAVANLYLALHKV